MELDSPANIGDFRKQALAVKEQSLVATIAVAAGVTFFGYSTSVLGVGLQLVEVIVLLAAVLVAAKMYLADDFSIQLPPAPVRSFSLAMFAAVAAIVAIALLSMIGARIPMNSVKFAIRYIMGMLIVYIVYRGVKTDREIETVIGAIKIACVVTALLIYAGYATPLKSLFFSTSGRARGLLLNPNQLGTCLAMAFPLFIHGLRKQPRDARALFATFAVFMALIASGSKTNILLSIVLGASYLLMPRGLKRRRRSVVSTVRRVLLAISVITVAIFVFAQISPMTALYIMNLISNPFQYYTFTIRLWLWSSAISMGTQHPLVGIGAGNIEAYLTIGHVHNVFLEFFATMGYLGLAALACLVGALVALYVRSIRSGLRADTGGRDPELRLVLPLAGLSYLISNQVSGSFSGTTLPLFWIMNGLLIASFRAGGSKQRVEER